MPAGDEPQGAEGGQAHILVGEDGHGQGHDPSAYLAGPLGRHQLVLRSLGRLGRGGQDVPVERAVGLRAHLGQ